MLLLQTRIVVQNFALHNCQHSKRITKHHAAKLEIHGSMLLDKQLCFLGALAKNDAVTVTCISGVLSSQKSLPVSFYYHCRSAMICRDDT